MIENLNLSKIYFMYVLDRTWLIILTTMIGRLCLAAAWQIQYLWCLELFPTTIRITMVQISMMPGYLGSAVAPLINDLVGGFTDNKHLILISLYVFANFEDQ